MHLIHLRDVDGSIEFAECDLSTRFFLCFAQRALGHAFAELHKAGWQRPRVGARLNGTKAK